MTNLKNYRVKKVTKGNGDVWYYPQKKFLSFWWWNVDDYGGYSYEGLAQLAIFNDYEKSQKDKVEYILPDNSKSNNPDFFAKPNPPPKQV